MEYYCVSDIGLVRKKNQDSYIVTFNKYNDCLALVADGIGGGLAGEVASGETILYFQKNFKDSGPFASLDDIISYLELHLYNCNKGVFDLSNSYRKYRGMGTTLTGILISNVGNVILNIGDSRVYGYLDDELFHLTKDHTLVNKMLDNNEITYEESLHHPKRHYLLKAVGIYNHIEPDIHRVKNMDYYLISSDGLHAYVSEEEMTDILKEDISVKEKTIKLKDLALLKGGFDNVTVILLKV